MEAFTEHIGIGVPLRSSNVDTDQIIPSEYCKRITRTGFEDALFAGWRTEPAFILNQPTFSEGSVLVAGPNFGTGSSREHAVWALRDYGFKAVLSSRFADIFRGNASKQGLVTAAVDQDVIDELWSMLEANPGTLVSVDLERQLVTCGDLVAEFTIDGHARYMLLNGLDDIGLTMEHTERIAAFERARPAWMPTTVQV